MGRLTHRTSPGWTYFVTTKSWQSTSVFQVPENAHVVVRKLLEYRDSGSYLLHEFVPMPNHLHVLLTPTHETTLEKAIQLIKGGSSYTIHKNRGIRAEIWQSGFHESRVRDSNDYENKLNYIRLNPVVARLVSRPEDWPYCSATGTFELDSIPQGLKPRVSGLSNVGPKGPTPNNHVEKLS
jgi:putative transposase